MPASSTRLKLVRCSARCDDQAGAVDRPGVTGQHVLTRFGAGVRFAKGGQFGDRVGIVGRIVEHRCVLEGERRW